MAEQEKKEYRENIGAFWLRKDKRGGHYIKGYLEINGERKELILFTNTFKTRMQHPDYVAREQIEKKCNENEQDNKIDLNI